MERFDLLTVLNHEKRGDLDSPEVRTLKQDEQERLVKQIMQLPFSESQVIILRYFRGMKLEEVAELMQISLSSVKRYLESGRKKLADKMK